jgi:hypothetical protein
MYMIYVNILMVITILVSFSPTNKLLLVDYTHKMCGSAFLR